MKENKIEAENEKVNENVFMNKSSFNYNEGPLATFTPKEKEGLVEKYEGKVDWLFCAECKYKCKKENSLKKHILIKYT